MLQNARVTAFTVSELLKENQQASACNFILKKTLAQVFFCEFFTEHLRVIASVMSWH